ncbi:MAG: prepilin-type N-terminal cleavage/methylation domain-containing protein [Candidatus Cloacimonadota bacterium]|nr:prepilin-type N-terminal cleavage/methylation domain-containing protein [Candidatus Cloacimonadota bacterium]
MFQQKKNQKGFSLIELLVVVVIIAILAAIAVPIYMSYVKKARSTEAQSAIAAIRQAYRAEYNQYGNTDDYTIEEAQKDVKLGKSTERNWEFEIIGNPPTKYIANSTAEFAEGEGKQVTYDVDEAMFHGYGIDEDSSSEDEVEY